MENLFTLLFSGIVAASTVVYAILTLLLVKETRLLRKAQTEPYISVTPYYHNYSDTFGLTVKNIGLGPAYGIKLALDKTIVYPNGLVLNDKGVFTSGIKYMAPGQEFQFVYAFADLLLQDKIDMPKELSIDVSFSDKADNRHCDSFNINFNEFLGVWQIKLPLNDIAKSVAKIEEILKKKLI